MPIGTLFNSEKISGLKKQVFTVAANTLANKSQKVQAQEQENLNDLLGTDLAYKQMKFPTCKGWICRVEFYIINTTQ